MARQQFTKGAIIRIPFDDQYHTYGRLLIPPNVAVYDCRLQHDIDIAEIIEKPILFIVAVYRRAISGGGWPKIGKVPTDADEILIPEKFIQDVTDPTYIRIMDIEGNERKATAEECIGLERMAVWEAWHVEERLRNHYEGKPYGMLERLKVKME